MKISVIIPTLNEERYLPKCLKSVLEQSLPRNMYEIIVVDSRSSDRTKEIAERYADHVLDVPRMGAGAARNAGAKRAKGEILLFLDADTFIRRDFMEKVLECFDDKAVVGGTCDIYSSDGTSFGNVFFRLINLIYRFVYLIGKPHAQTKCCFYRKDVFRKLGGFNESLIVTEDQEMAWRAGKVGRMVYLKNTAAFSSMRRERTLGYGRTVARWLKNYFSVLLFKRSEQVWSPIR